MRALASGLGHGVGLRAAHYASWEASPREVAWTECITENYLGESGPVGGRPRQVLEYVRSHIPLVLHGVSMSIGGLDPLDRTYLRALKELADAIEPEWVSDHLCWGAIDGHHLHDLLPIPFTEEALDHITPRVLTVQDLLARPLVLENPSTYVAFDASVMPEWEFLAELARRTGARVLLDVNNVFVSAKNHGFSADDYLAGIPVDAVAQFHLAGHTDAGTHLLDTHDGPVCDAVWALYEKAIQRFGDVATLIEWDAKLPPYADLVAEARRSADVARRALRVDE
jgi:uncharacterized protein